MPPPLDSKKLGLPPDAIIDGSTIKFKDKQGMDHQIIFEDYQMSNQEVALYYKFASMFLPTFPNMVDLTFDDLVRLNAVCTLAYFGYINPTMKKKAELFGQKAIRVVIKVLYRRMVFEKKAPVKKFPIALPTEDTSAIDEIRNEFILAKSQLLKLIEGRSNDCSADLSALTLKFLELCLENPNLAGFTDFDKRTFHGILIQLIFCRLMSYEIDPGDARKVFKAMVELHPDFDDLLNYIMIKNLHIKIKDPDKRESVTNELNDYLGISSLTDNDTFNLIIQALMHYDKRLSGKQHEIIYKEIGDLSTTYLEVYWKETRKKSDFKYADNPTYQSIWETALLTRTGLTLGWTSSHISSLFDRYKHYDPGDYDKFYSYLSESDKLNLLHALEEFKVKEDEFRYFWEADKIAQLSL